MSSNSKSGKKKLDIHSVDSDLEGTAGKIESILRKFKTFGFVLVIVLHP